MQGMVASQIRGNPPEYIPEGIRVVANGNNNNDEGKVYYSTKELLAELNNNLNRTNAKIDTLMQAITNKADKAELTAAVIRLEIQEREMLVLKAINTAHDKEESDKKGSRHWMIDLIVPTLLTITFGVLTLLFGTGHVKFH